MKSMVKIALVCTLLVVAGCTGVGNSPAQNTSSTHVQSSSTTQPPSDTIQFESLDNDTKQIVKEAITNSPARVADDDLPDRLSPTRTPIFVRYGDSIYNVTVQKEGMIAKYQLGRTPEVNHSEIENSSDVIRYDSLNNRSKRMFERVQGGQPTPEYTQAEFPSVLMNNDFVKQNGTYYRIVIYTVDHTAYEITAKNTRS